MGTRDRRAGGSLTKRTVAVSALLSAVIGTAFFLLALAIDALRGLESRANHALEVQVAANHLERLVVDIETAQRGFVITGESRFIKPWYQARTEFTRQAATLEQLASAEIPARAGRRTRSRRPLSRTSGITRSRWWRRHSVTRSPPDGGGDRGGEAPGR